MSFSIPDQGEGLNAIQSILFQEYLDVLIAGVTGYECVISGGLVTAQGTPDMTVAVAKAGVLTNGVLKPAAAATKAISAADATNPRLDLIVVDSAGALQVRTGTAAAAPKPAARSANDVVLAVVYVPANASVIAATQITDLRILRGKGPLGIGKVTTPVTANTTNTIQTYFSLTIPDGMLLTGKIIDVVCGGTYLNNAAGSATWTLTIAYGGTTMFADATAATAADADRGAWSLRFNLVAASDSSQALSGLVSFQTPLAKGAPTNGIGDLAVVTHVAAPISGTAAVNSDSADRTLTVQWTMSVSDVNVETSMTFAEAAFR